MEIVPVAGALGAEISGIDLTKELSAEDAKLINDNFLKHKVLFFRDQKLYPQRFLSFSKVIGRPIIYPFIKGLKDIPEIIEIVKTKNDKKNFGGSWHSDTSYMEKPAMATLLYAKDVPEYGGDTLFSNTALAYDHLSPKMKELLIDIIGINSSEKGYDGGRAAGMSRLDKMKKTFDQDALTYESKHPVIRTHPETGLKSLYLNK